MTTTSETSACGASTITPQDAKVPQLVSMEEEAKREEVNSESNEEDILKRPEDLTIAVVMATSNSSTCSASAITSKTETDEEDIDEKPRDIATAKEEAGTSDANKEVSDEDEENQKERLRQKWRDIRKRKKEWLAETVGDKYELKIENDRLKKEYKRLKVLHRRASAIVKILENGMNSSSSGLAFAHNPNLHMAYPTAKPILLNNGLLHVPVQKHASQVLVQANQGQLLSPVLTNSPLLVHQQNQHLLNLAATTAFPVGTVAPGVAPTLLVVNRANPSLTDPSLTASKILQQPLLFHHQVQAAQAQQQQALAMTAAATTLPVTALPGSPTAAALLAGNGPHYVMKQLSDSGKPTSSIEVDSNGDCPDVTRSSYI